MGLEADVAECFEVEDVAAVKEEGGLEHLVEDGLVIEFGKLVPLSENSDSMGLVAGLFGRRVGVHSGMIFGDSDVGADLLVGHFGVVNMNFGLFVEKVAADVNRGGFASVVGVFFEGEAEEGDLLARDGVKEGGDYPFNEALALVVVHLDDLLPVFRDFGEAVVLAEVDKIEDVFLEAGSTESNGGFQEFWSNAGVCSDSAGHFIDIRFGGLAECRDGVDGGDSLGKKGVGGEFGKL